MKDDRALILLAGAAGLVWLWRRQAPARYAPDTDSAGFFGEPAPAPGTDSIPPPKTNVSGVSLGWAPAPVRAAVDMERWTSDAPTPGQFYAVRRRDHIEGIASRAAGELARQAALDAGHGQDAAAQWSERARRSPTVVREAWHSISAGWNDELFGSSLVEVTAPWGRGLDLKPVHNDIAQQIADGRTPRRNLDAVGNPTLTGPSSRPFLWIPRWSGKALLESMEEGRGNPIRAADWPDGSAGTWPPATVTERGVIYGQR